MGSAKLQGFFHGLRQVVWLVAWVFGFESWMDELFGCSINPQWLLLGTRDMPHCWSAESSSICWHRRVGIYYYFLKFAYPRQALGNLCQGLLSHGVQLGRVGSKSWGWASNTKRLYMQSYQCCHFAAQRPWVGSFFGSGPSSGWVSPCFMDMWVVPQCC